MQRESEDQKLVLNAAESQPEDSETTRQTGCHAWSNGESEIDQKNTLPLDASDEWENLTEDSRHENIVGTTIGGHYQILERIGEGGAGVVYRAKHLLLNRDVAVKIISPEVRMGGKVLMRFQQEAKAVTSLSHPNIVKTYEFGVADDGSPFLTMEYAEGQTVAELIAQSGKQPIERSVDIITQAGQGLTYAHANGVVHRDIKPENIVLSAGKDGRELAKILDFGIAKIIDQPDGQKLTETGNIIGSPLYMSPEQCLGKELDRRSDVYSLACVLYELLVGHPPFRGQSKFETLTHHIQTPPPDIPKEIASSSINSCLLKALAKQPERRFQTVESFVDALKTALTEPDTGGGINDIRFWRSLDRFLGARKSLQEQILARFMFYSIVAVILFCAAVFYFLVTTIELAPNSVYDDPTAWTEYIDLGRRARNLGEYSKAEQLFLDAECNAQFSGQREARILALQELQKLYEQRGMDKEAKRTAERIKQLNGFPHSE